PGKSPDNPEAIVAYSPSDQNGRTVVFADGSVQTLSAEKFQEALQRDAALPRVETAARVQTSGQAAVPSLNQPPAPTVAPAQPPPPQAAAQIVFANGLRPAAPAAAPV